MYLQSLLVRSHVGPLVFEIVLVACSKKQIQWLELCRFCTAPEGPMSSSFY